MLRPIVDEVFAIGETEVRRYVGLQFMMEAMNHVAEEKGDAIKYVSSACALGYFARRVEFRVLKLDEFNETVRDFLEWAAAEGKYGEDWFGTITGAVQTLANASEASTVPNEETAALLAQRAWGGMHDSASLFSS